MQEMFTFDDVLIVPQFSDIKSRKEVNLGINTTNDYALRTYNFSLPIISANMDTITGPRMSKAMLAYGANACLHRFSTIEENVMMFEGGSYCFDEDLGLTHKPMVSIGLGKEELDRARALFEVGANHFIIDVAHGAQSSVVDQVRDLRAIIRNEGTIMVGNFAGKRSVEVFMSRCGDLVDAIKVGVGPGSACTTRIKTGVGYPQLSAVQEISNHLRIFCPKVVAVADGGMKTPGDIAKALGAGASMVMLGGMLAGTAETPGDTVQQDGKPCSSVSFSSITKVYKKYRGSASKESYDAQGKTGSHRTSEGESFMVPFKGPVKEVLQDIEGGLRSAFTYVGARNLQEFHRNVEFVRISPSTVKENGAHGK